MNEVELKQLFELSTFDYEKFFKELNAFAEKLHGKNLKELNDTEKYFYIFLQKHARKYDIQVIVESDAEPEILANLLTQNAVQGYLESCNSILKIKTNFQS